LGETITPRTSLAGTLRDKAADAQQLIPEPVRRVSGKDLLAGFTNAIANIPDAMANAALAGLSPIHGLYALVVGTPVAALTTSSKLMTVAVTGSMALITADTLAPISPADRARTLIMLTLLVGVLQVALGLLRTGGLVRFVSNSVMRGFLTGVAVNIVLSQIAGLTGYSSSVQNKVVRLIDTLMHPGRMSGATLIVSAITVATILLLEHTRLRTFAFPVALVISAAAAPLFKGAVVLVGDVSPIPAGLPSLSLPPISLALPLLIPAVAIALVGLIQGAGISRSVPNPDGNYPRIDGDFIGQGMANATASVFGGMPVGASISSTALNVQLGGRNRAANFIIGPIIALILLAFSGAVELIPQAALAALLVIIGIRAIDLPAIKSVWFTSLPPRSIMLVTFVATLVVPVQYAVLMGVALSVVQHVYSSSLDIMVVRLHRDSAGNLVEEAAPDAVSDNSVTVLDIYGSVFYAGTDVIDGLLPDVTSAKNAVVVLRLRGRADVGSTFLDLLTRLAEQIGAGGGYLALVGVGPALRDQLTRTGTAELIGEDHIYLAEPVVTASLERAVNEAEAWLALRETTGADAS